MGRYIYGLGEPQPPSRYHGSSSQADQHSRWAARDEEQRRRSAAALQVAKVQRGHAASGRRVAAYRAACGVQVEQAMLHLKQAVSALQRAQAECQRCGVSGLGAGFFTRAQEAQGGASVARRRRTTQRRRRRRQAVRAANDAQRQLLGAQAHARQVFRQLMGFPGLQALALELARAINATIRGQGR